MKRVSVKILNEPNYRKTRYFNLSWYDNAVFYHIYPLGLTGAPKQNDYSEPVHRLNSLIPWISHIRDLDAMRST